jgi:hypothetical protein
LVAKIPPEHFDPRCGWTEYGQGQLSLLEIFLDFRDESFVETFSEQHCRDPCLEVMLPEDGQNFFVFVLESTRILLTVSARPEHMSGCVAT